MYKRFDRLDDLDWDEDEEVIDLENNNQPEPTSITIPNALIVNKPLAESKANILLDALNDYKAEVVSKTKINPSS